MEGVDGTDGDDSAATSRAPFRPTAALYGFYVVAIVWCSYHYTGAAFAAAMELLSAGTDVGAVKDGVIQLMSAIVGNIVAVAGVSAIGAALVKLCER